MNARWLQQGTMIEVRPFVDVVLISLTAMRVKDSRGDKLSGPTPIIPDGPGRDRAGKRSRAQGARAQGRPPDPTRPDPRFPLRSFRHRRNLSSLHGPATGKSSRARRQGKVRPPGPIEISFAGFALCAKSPVPALAACAKSPVPPDQSSDSTRHPTDRNPVSLETPPDGPPVLRSASRERPARPRTRPPPRSARTAAPPCGTG